jgi:hypothetical protein
LVIVYRQEPEFVPTAVPDSLTVLSGNQTASLVYLTALGGFTQSLTMTVGGLPPFATAQWQANHVTPTASTLLTVTTPPDTPGGIYTLTLTGTARSQVHATTVKLQVQHPDFALDVTPSSRAVTAGQSATYTAFLTATDGFTRSVALSVGGLPANTTAAWQTNPLTPTTRTTLTLSTTAETPEGSYPLVVTGTAGSLVHTATVTLHVFRPGTLDFALDVVPPARTVTASQSTTYTALLDATGEFTRGVRLDVGGLPPLATVAWAANPVTPTASTILTVNTTVETPAGSYTLFVTGTASSLIHTATVTLHVSVPLTPDFALAIVPSSRVVTAGQSTTYTAFLTATDGFTRGVRMDVGDLPAHTFAAWQANPVTPTAHTALVVTTTDETPAGVYTLLVTGTSNGTLHSVTTVLSVTQAIITHTVYLPVVLRDYAPQTALAPATVSRAALFIGIADYEHMEPITGTRAGVPGNKLGYSGDDAVNMDALYLTRGTLDSSNTALLLESQATKATIHAAIVNWLDPIEDENTTIVIFFSGHGMYGPDDNGDENDPYDEFIVPYEIEWDEIQERWRHEMAIRDDELEQWLSVLESRRIVIILDSCFSGGMIQASYNQLARGVGQKPPAAQAMTAAQWRDGFVQDIRGPGRIVLAASAEDQSSWEFGELGDGAFTYYLLEAMTTPSADTSSNGWVSAEEAFAYAAGRVDNYVWTKTNTHQNPQMSDGVSGQVDLVQLGAAIGSCPAW